MTSQQIQNYSWNFHSLAIRSAIVTKWTYIHKIKKQNQLSNWLSRQFFFFFSSFSGLYLTSCKLESIKLNQGSKAENMIWNYNKYRINENLSISFSLSTDQHTDFYCVSVCFVFGIIVCCFWIVCIICQWPVHIPWLNKMCNTVKVKIKIYLLEMTQ